MQEQWRPILGYEGYYEISNLGRVKSLQRTFPMKDGRRNYTVREKILVPNGKVYHVIKLTKNCDKITANIHQLVWDAFGNEPCKEGYDIDHIDTNQKNNVITNLRLLRHRDNVYRSVKKKYGDLPGANYDKSRGNWRADISSGKKKKYLGSFNTEQEAHQAYLKARKEIYGKSF